MGGLGVSLPRPCRHASRVFQQTRVVHPSTAHLSEPVPPPTASWVLPTAHDRPVCPGGAHGPPSQRVGNSRPGQCVWPSAVSGHLPALKAHLGFASPGSPRVKPGQHLPLLGTGLLLRSPHPGLGLWGSGSPSNKELGGLTLERGTVIRSKNGGCCVWGSRSPGTPAPGDHRTPWSSGTTGTL